MGIEKILKLATPLVLAFSLNLCACSSLEDRENNAKHVISKEKTKGKNHFILGPKDRKKIKLECGEWKKNIIKVRNDYHNHKESHWRWESGGYIILEMEKMVYDRKGTDFYVEASGGEYEVFFAIKDDGCWYSAGIGEDSEYFRLPIDMAKYVKIKCVDDKPTKIDSVKRYMFLY